MLESVQMRRRHFKFNVLEGTFEIGKENVIFYTINAMHRFSLENDTFKESVFILTSFFSHFQVSKPVRGHDSRLDF